MSQTLKETKSAQCSDKNCPFHGSLSIRGKTLTGRVVSDRMHKTVVVQVDYLYYYPKYKRYAKRRSKIHAHNPPCVGAAKGDVVKIAECRPLSKTVGFVVVEKSGGE
ncbi:MAG: 30S ribosomal protein S17 [Candidatus Methanomethylicia archaeon]|jgi:small subunit ribosomal protein S17|uniref:Small ribosomal subunit protein uS17 n=1 Tax=Thermoproteota archaeon TaxID=2056631 RepID=A0A523BFS9_9CREN|nr:30S ribosomal protein S17 [Candidatus Methanomethylicia archaeon]MCQ5373858.1 30S ribosomal protein S17 [Candidatus Methanomethylicia archaeon]NHV60452.1 30S ribosomal protein S17 [Candidatus Verstraetearchaeota archaeon]TDA39764.1 MAG: 30S ribosomal protein S17 [Candidatus Verstraetearchaeota archaeon]